ncbi:MAG: penicillin-binding protein 1A [Oleispira sp.]|nr:penicillin-binding protein 1A [Oleispira sp.]
MMNSSSISRFLFWLIVSVFSGTSLLISAVYLYLTPQLPDIQSLKKIELQIPLRIYTEDGQLISEFGEQRRRPLSYQEIPSQFVHALIAAEDDRFFQHNGVDLKGLTRAALQLIKTGKKKSGGSTITMQVAKNYYLSSEKTFSRKFTEILLALKIEQELSKEEILELYLNKIYLGKRAYGIEAAAQVYYGVSVSELKLPQLAMLAGLPQAPSAANPINNPRRAKERRNYVLARMHTLDFIDQQQFDDAAKAPITARYHGLEAEVEASYIAEMVRQELFEQYGGDIYRLGFRVTTTLNSKAQTQANKALQAGLLKYDRDHGLRTQASIELLPLTKLQTFDNEITLTWPNDLDEQLDIDWPATLNAWQKKLNTKGQHGLIHPAIVAQTLDNGAWIISGRKQWSWLPFSGLQWAKPYIDVNRVGKEPKRTQDILSPGQMIWITASEHSGIQLAQIPEAEGALISIDPKQGAIRALVGGFSYGLNKYNRAIQADRQPGSAFKPFIYSAALANGFTPASIINDAPVVYKDAGLENTWRPENSSGKFYGPTRLREALYKSQNLVSIRILKQISPHKAINYITPFGFPRKKLNKDLSLALGASAITPLELATGYTVLANGGFQIEPYFIQRIEVGNEEQPRSAATPVQACLECEAKMQNAYTQAETETITAKEKNEEQALLEAIGAPLAEPLITEITPAIKLAPRIMDPRTHFIMNNMLQDVIKRGTGKRALALKRSDLAGKTGTTNDQKDAWFSGYNRDLVTSVWIGFDQPKTLGRWAFGGNTALPIWVEYMGAMLADKKQRSFPQPTGIVTVRIDPETGLLAQPGQSNAIFELFKQEQLPAAADNPTQASEEQESNDDEEDTPELLF